MQLDFTRRRTIVVVAAALGAGCVGGGDASTTSADSGGAAPVGLQHVNGAVLDSAPVYATAPRRASIAASSNGGAPRGRASNGGGTVAGRAATTSDGDALSAAETASASRALGRSPAGSAGVAPTPDELSALAASLVVPVAGVTRAELQDSFEDARGGGTRTHHALDIPAPRGTPVISATSGRVLRLFNSKQGGTMVYAADPTERFILMYAHLDRYADGIQDGMPLSRGQTIGYVGTTGNAPPNVPHLHFAIARTNNVSRWWNGTPIDPFPLLRR